MSPIETLAMLASFLVSKVGYSSLALWSLSTGFPNITFQTELMSWDYQSQTISSEQLCPDPNNFPADAQDLGQLDLTPTPSVFSGLVGIQDEQKLYRFTLQATNTVRLRLEGLTQNASLQLADATGTLIQTSDRPGTQSERITADLEPGVYFVAIAVQRDRQTPYDLVLSAQFIPEDRLVSSGRLGPVIDLEIDPVDLQAAWQDDRGNLWVAPIQPQTGNFVSQQAEIVDSQLPPVVSLSRNAAGTGDGPEWVVTDGASELLYTKLMNNEWVIYRARKRLNRWFPSLLPDSQGKFAPKGSQDRGDDQPRLIYRVGSPNPPIQVVSRPLAFGWQALNRAEVGEVLPAEASVPSWIDGERALSFTQSVDGIRQVFYLNIDTGNSTQLTFDALPKKNVQIWRAPEFNNEPVLLVTSSATDNDGGLALAESINLYRRVGNQWIRYKTLDIPTRLPFLRFVREFVYNGQSYLSLLALDELNGKNAEVWIAGIDPEVDFYRQVNDPAAVQNPDDPEPFVLPTGAVIYYADLGSNLRIADTGLGPPQRDLKPSPSPAGQLRP